MPACSQVSALVRARSGLPGRCGSCPSGISSAANRSVHIRGCRGRQPSAGCLCSVLSLCFRASCLRRTPAPGSRSPCSCCALSSCVCQRWWFLCRYRPFRSMDFRACVCRSWLCFPPRSWGVVAVWVLCCAAGRHASVCLGGLGYAVWQVFSAAVSPPAPLRLRLPHSPVCLSLCSV